MKIQQLKPENKKNMNTRHIFTILYFSTIVFLGSGCFKQDPAISENVTRKGRVMEKYTKKPIAKAKIYIYRKKLSDFDPLGSGGGSGSLIDSFYSDHNGYYSHTYFDEIGYLYTLKGIAEGYYLGESNGTTGTRKEPKADILLDAKAWIKFHVKNVNPFNEYDKISINSGFFSQFIGEKIDTIIVEKVIGNQKFTFTNFIYKNNNKSIIKDSIDFIPAHDTIFHEIKY